MVTVRLWGSDVCAYKKLFNFFGVDLNQPDTRNVYIYYSNWISWFLSWHYVTWYIFVKIVAYGDTSVKISKALRLTGSMETSIRSGTYSAALISHMKMCGTLRLMVPGCEIDARLTLIKKKFTHASALSCIQTVSSIANSLCNWPISTLRWCIAAQRSKEIVRVHFIAE